MSRLICAAAGLVLAFNAGPGRAAETVDDSAGTLNPQELTIDYWARHVDDKTFDPKLCMFGYPAAKMGSHPAARRIFERCANAGVTGAMPWMSWTEENGYDKPSDPAKAALWDKRLADTGSSLGAFNYGLDLLRGRGVPQDVAEGRTFIDRAAAGGDATARELAAHDCDPEAVTPEADKDRYRKFGF